MQVPTVDRAITPAAMATVAETLGVRSRMAGIMEDLTVVVMTVGPMAAVMGAEGIAGEAV